MASKGESAGLSGYPTMQLRTHRHGPRTRPRHPRPRSLTTPQSRRRAVSASRAGPSVAGLGLQPDERTLRAEAPALGSSESRRPSGVLRRVDETRAPFRPPRSRPLPGRSLGTSHYTRLGTHSFETPALHRQAAVPTAGPGSAPAPRRTPPSLAGDP